MKPLIRRASLLLLLTASATARAEGGRVDQIERLDIERSQLEIELQAIGVQVRTPQDDDDEIPEGDSRSLRTTIEYGLSDRLQLGVEFSGEKTVGSRLSLRQIGVQFKWIALSPDEAPIGLGIQSAAVVGTNGGGIGNETYLIAERHFGLTDAVANIILETDPGDWSHWRTSYGLRLDRDLNDRLALGIEVGGDLSGEGEGSHFIGPVVDSRPWGQRGPEIEFSLFAPLNKKAPALQLRLEIDWAF